MRHRTPLPDQLGSRFAVRDAVAAGVGRSRYSGRDLARPFHGVRSAEHPVDLLARLACYLPRLKPGHLVAGKTALRVWGYPIAGAWTGEEQLEIVVTTDAARPRARGVRGLRLARGRVRPWMIGEIPIVDPVAALFMCASDMSRTQIVIVIDALITTSRNYPGLNARRPISSVAEIEQRLCEWGRFPGCGRVREAIALARECVESPKETETRLLLRECGLPEPAVQHEVRADGRFVARVDLAYPEWKIAIEYEGDGHRTSRDQWRRDIQRQRELEDLGWVIVRVTELDLNQGGAAVVARIRRAASGR